MTLLQEGSEAMTFSINQQLLPTDNTRYLSLRGRHLDHKSALKANTAPIAAQSVHACQPHGRDQQIINSQPRQVKHEVPQGSGI